jgi:hypothetical protein
MPLLREWAARIGRRNIAYVVFVSLLVPFAGLIEASGPRGPDAGGGVAAAIMLWVAVSAVFFLANLAALLVRLIRGQPIAKPLIACILPIVCFALPLLLEPIFLR